jgi:hypothetical protein
VSWGGLKTKTVNESKLSSSPARSHMTSKTRAGSKPTIGLATWLPVAFVALAAAAAYAAVASNALVNARLEADEVGWLIKAWWYISGAIAPYSSVDSAPTLPLFPFGLGAIQTLIGLDVTAARSAMIVVGVANAVVLFLLCRKLTGNVLTSTAAVLIFVGSPSTSFSFSTTSPIGIASLLHLGAIWLLVLSVGRPALWRSLLLGAIFGALLLLSGEMAIPILALFVVFMAAVGKARWVQGAIVVAVVAVIVGACVALLPDQFTAVLLNQPAPAFVRGLIGMGAPVSLDALRIGQDLYEGVLLPYGGTLLLCVLLIALTWQGPRVLWVVPIYTLIALLGLIVFRAPGCEACAATAPSQISAVAALAAAMTLAFLARVARQNKLASTPLVIGAAFTALALNTFAPLMATREALHSFPAAMLMQSRAGAEQDDVAALMRFVGQNVPTGSEPILLVHRLPALPYAVHMAGRRFPAVSLNPIASLRAAPAAATGARREAALAAIERGGNWTGETLRRWVERDYELIIWQEGALNVDAATADLLAANFDAAATTDYRGAKLTLYKRKG